MPRGQSRVCDVHGSPPALAGFGSGGLQSLLLPRILAFAPVG